MIGNEIACSDGVIFITLFYETIQNKIYTDKLGSLHLPSTSYISNMFFLCSLYFFNAFALIPLLLSQCRWGDDLFDFVVFSLGFPSNSLIILSRKSLCSIFLPVTSRYNHTSSYIFKCIENIFLRYRIARIINCDVNIMSIVFRGDNYHKKMSR